MALTTNQLLAHLGRRAGFGPSQAEIGQYRTLTFEGSVYRLVDDETIGENLDPNGEVNPFDPTRMDTYRSVWFYRMVRSQKQLREKMTFFWHDHFACDLSTVGNVGYMWRQNELFRTYALSDFKTLLTAVAKDPAMMIQLDTVINSKGNANENYAREIMELHALGEGNYTEDDIKEAARCFTGWRIDANGNYTLNAGRHDTGSKTIFDTDPQTGAPMNIPGVTKTGNLDGTDVIDSLVRHPACAPFLAEKLYRFFVSDTPDPVTIAAAAKAYSDNGFSIKEMVRSILLSAAFQSEAAYHSRVKSPLEFMIGLVKHLNLPKVPLELPSMLRSLAQDMFEPPSVKGWPVSSEWVGTTAILTRANHINRLVSGKGAPSNAYFIDPIQLAASMSQSTVDGLIDMLMERWIDGDITPNVRARLLSYYAAAPRRTAEAPQAPAAPNAPYQLYLTGIQKSNDPGYAKYWTGQTRKLRGLYYLTLSSPAYQAN